MDTYADDLATLVETLDLQSAIHVGHSTGGGEVARYIGRYGTKRVAKAVLIGAVPPMMLRTAANPGGLPMDTKARLLVSQGGSHGICSTEKNRVNEDLLAFFRE